MLTSRGILLSIRLRTASNICPQTRTEPCQVSWSPRTISLVKETKKKTPLTMSSWERTVLRLSCYQNWHRSPKNSLSILNRWSSLTILSIWLKTSLDFIPRTVTGPDFSSIKRLVFVSFRWWTLWMNPQLNWKSTISEDRKIKKAACFKEDVRNIMGLPPCPKQKGVVCMLIRVSTVVEFAPTRKEQHHIILTLFHALPL